MDALWKVATAAQARAHAPRTAAPMPNVDPAKAQRARKGGQVHVCGRARREKATEGGAADDAQLARTYALRHLSRISFKITRPPSILLEEHGAWHDL